METEVETNQPWLPTSAEQRLATPDTREGRVVRRWLEDAWRHGETLADADGVQPTASNHPVDRFRVKDTTIV